jgi:hypothetical protein
MNAAEGVELRVQPLDPGEAGLRRLDRGQVAGGIEAGQLGCRQQGRIGHEGLPGSLWGGDGAEPIITAPAV